MKFAVLGAGSAGQGLAGYLGLKGNQVKLYNRSGSKIEPVIEQGGLKVTGVRDGFVKITEATTDIEKVVTNTDVILITARAYGHRDIFKGCLPYLDSRQIVVFMTGYWASLRVNSLFDRFDTDLTLAETTLLPVVSEIIKPGEVRITGIKSKMRIASLPSKNLNRVLDVLQGSLPQLFPGRNVLETNLENFNPIFHSPIALLNLGEIERDDKFEFYHQGVTPKVAKVIDILEEERMRLIEALDLDLGPCREMIKDYYITSGESTYEIFRNCEAYKGYVLPNVFNYIKEDVPYGLVPMASLCESFGLPNKGITSIIDAWSLIDGVDYWEEGITVGELGLLGQTRAEILESFE